MATCSLVSAAPGHSLFRRQASSCSTTYGCPFELMVAGCQAKQLVDGQLRVQNGSITELTDGQARCDPNGTTATNFTLSNGQVTDSSGRLCEISSQDQFQCSAKPDTGATTTGFSVCNGLLSFNGSSSFIACLATGSIPGYNIYTANVNRSTVTDCMPVELDVPACAVSSSSCVASTTTQTVVTTSVPAAVTVTTTATDVPAAVTVTVTATTTYIPAAITVTDVKTDVPAAVTVTATVTPAAITVTATQPAQTVSVTQPAQTVTLPASTITVEQTIVQTVVQTQTKVNTETDVPTKIDENTVVDTVTAKQTIVDTITATPVVATTAQATSSSAQATCTNIVRSLGSSSFPNTIEVINSGSDVSGSSYFAYIGSGNSTIFTFNSQSSTGECSLNFLFPTTAEIEAAAGTTSYLISSSSISVTLYELDSVAAVTDTYATKPARGAAFTATLTPGTSTTFTTFTCSSGQTSYELVADDSITLSFFEDYNLPVLGLTVATC